jgi:hypothetical protein
MRKARQMITGVFGRFAMTFGAVLVNGLSSAYVLAWTGHVVAHSGALLRMKSHCYESLG